MFTIQKLVHASLVVADTRRALEFYRDILGLSVLDRPDLGFPGAWLDLGNVHLHLLEVSNPDPVQGRPAHGGRDRHLALAITELSTLCARLDKHGVPYTLSKSGRRACFFRDQDGNTLECIEQADA